MRKVVTKYAVERFIVDKRSREVLKWLSGHRTNERDPFQEQLTMRFHILHTLVHIRLYFQWNTLTEGNLSLLNSTAFLRLRISELRSTFSRYRDNLQRLSRHHTTNKVFSRFPLSISDAFTISPFGSVRLMPSAWSILSTTERLWIRWGTPIAGQRSWDEKPFLPVKTSTNFVSRTPSRRSTARFVILYLKSSRGYCTCASCDFVIECSRRPMSPSPERQSFDNRWATSRDDFVVEAYAHFRQAPRLVLLPQGRDSGRRASFSDGPEHRSKRKVSGPSVDLVSYLPLYLEECLYGREWTRKNVSAQTFWERTASINGIKEAWPWDTILQILPVTSSKPKESHGEE